MPPPLPSPRHPSAWAQHLARYRANHPEKSLKQSMIGASASYRKPNTHPTPRNTTQTNARRSVSSNPRVVHVNAYRSSQNGEIERKVKEAMEEARRTGMDVTSNTDDSQFQILVEVERIVLDCKHNGRPQETKRSCTVLKGVYINSQNIGISKQDLSTKLSSERVLRTRLDAFLNGLKSYSM